MTDEQLLAAIPKDPAFLLHQIDPAGGLVQFLKVEERAYRDSIFMDQRLQAANAPSHVLPLWPTVAATNPRLPSLPCDYVFHIGHCGSTMISRAIESQGALALREPPPLRVLAQARRALGTPLSHLDQQQYDSLRTFIGGLLARSFEPGGPNLVKASSDCGNLAEDLLDLNPANRALLVYLPLESFLTVMLRDAGKRRESAHFAASRLADLHALLGDDSVRLYDLSDAEKTAMNWLAGMSWLAAQDPKRTLLIDFDALLQDPAKILAKACDFVARPVSRTDLGAMLKGPLFNSYSKDPSAPYNPASRAAELAESRARHSDEINTGLGWAQSLCERFEDLSPLQRFCS